MLNEANEENQDVQSANKNLLSVYEGNSNGKQGLYDQNRRVEVMLQKRIQANSVRDIQTPRAPCPG